MTIDERLDRLTERQEALAQSLELLFGNMREIAHRHQQLAQCHEHLTQFHEELAADVHVLNVKSAQLMDIMNRLGNIVISHDERLDGLDGGTN